MHLETMVESEVTQLAPDGGLEKTVLRAGAGEPAGMGAQVRMHYSMRYPGEEVADAFDKSSDRLRHGGELCFTVGRRKTIYAVERIAESMCEGELCDVVCSPKYTFGSYGYTRKGVKPNSTVVIRAEMLSFVSATAEKSYAEMTPKERFAKAEQFKEIGNKLFKETKYKKAVQEYSNAIRLLSNIFNQPMQRPKTTEPEPATIPSSVVEAATANPVVDTDEDGFQEAEIVIDATGDDGVVTEVVSADAAPADDTPKDASPEEPVVEEAEVVEDGLSEEEVIGLHVRTLNNLALCCFKLGEHVSAEEGATLAIRLDENNFKGYYYRARARSAMGKLYEARTDLHLAAKIKPMNTGIRAELDAVEKKIKVQKHKERKQAEAMFA